MFLLILEYLLLAFIVIFATSRLSYFIDELDKKTHISGALIGGVLLATVTSMPEFITSITSTVRLGEPGLAFGNVFGSNIFNIVILAVADIIFIKHMFFNKVKTQRKTNALVILMYIVFMIPLILSGFTGLDYNSFTINILLIFNVISLVIVVIYLFSIKAMNEDETEQSEEVSKLSYKKIGISFVLWSVVVIVSSFFVTIVANNLGTELNLGSSFAGAIFLGVATSLPELTAVMTLMKLRNYEAALGNIIGSNIFNMTIISVVDIINVKEDIFKELVDNRAVRENISYLLILGLINSIILMLALIRKDEKSKITYIIPSVLILVAYFIYIGLSL
ncbi:putative calcium/sodium:proton antiporter [Candidatus Izimaplasma bacterium HR1]|jgi:cation:H+ antiporter|uniref:sodium:calcium antiporter n=1 Tax=Candidatus Izimoplasma sp. HR1 TaxID=1541959 RepID=UPI0004F8C072|nr:putative calcium/sodium:proton antiporter [Candidatus Izimaplasma bacterium HR1]